MKRILFQGDSITDAGWNRNDSFDLGKGYPRVVGGRLGYDYPLEYEFLNRGISGNRIVDVYARIKADIINLKPDYMSLLIGVNDVWAELIHENGIDAEKFYKIYDMLIEEICTALPNLKIMILLPYVLEGNATVSTEENPGRFEYFKAEVAKRSEKAKMIAEKYNLPCIDLQTLFEEAVKKTGDSSYWVWDGVHPTITGHELIARAWLKAFEEMK